MEAGLALKTQGSLVKGFTPLRAGTAGFLASFMFMMPANLKEPFFFNSLAAMSTTALNASFTCFGFKPTASAAAPATALWDMATAPFFRALGNTMLQNGNCLAAPSVTPSPQGLEP